MSMDDLDIEGIKEAGQAKEKSSGSGRQISADKAQFDAAMENKTTAQMDPTAMPPKAESALPSSHPTLIEQITKANQTEQMNSSAHDLASKAQGMAADIEKVKATFANDPRINSSYRELLRNRLTHIDDSLKIALSKAGVEYTSPEQKSQLLNPVERFLGNLSHAQFQLESLGQYLEGISNSNEKLSPANMLAVQIKVNHIQQELEFFTGLLNKALESTKTIMNVQV